MDTNTINNATMTKQDYRREILRKYSAVLKSCRNLVTQDDIRQVRQAFDIALKNATEDTKLDYEEIIRILDTTLIITQEIGLGRTSIICAANKIKALIFPWDKTRNSTITYNNFVS